VSGPLVCLVTNRHALAPDARTQHDEFAALEAQCDEAADAGVDFIQLRERDLEAADLQRLTSRLLSVTRGRTKLIVNDRADVARAAGADGVHLRGDGPPVAVVRQLAPPGWTIGRSIHSTAEAREAGEAGSAGAADYLVFGTVFPSRSKSSGAPAAGVAALAAAAAASTVPVLAIGGVTSENAARCREAGAAGVAAIEMFLPAGCAPSARGPRGAMAAIRAAWQGSALE
jgi:thiamine-phosphate diphosphorylase